LIKKINILLKVSLIFFLSTASVFAELKEELIKKLILTKTLSFDFKQKVEEKEERGSCFIKYPLLIRCNYTNVKEKILISNGRTVAIIKKKYKKIYFYPLKKTPLIIVLDKEKILKLIKNNKPARIDSDTVVFDFLDKNLGEFKIIFDKNTLNLKGWEIKDAYSNEVNFQMINVKINNQIVDNFFKIPKEDDL
jgi:outer membrane lipoprotein-sorting protein